MSDDVVMLRKKLRDHPKTLAIAEALGLDRDTVVGKLFALWSWGEEFAVDGTAAHASYATVDEYVRCPEFARAVEQVGWLASTDQAIVLPNFTRWNTEAAKARALATRRKQRQRAKAKQDKAESPPFKLESDPPPPKPEAADAAPKKPAATKAAKKEPEPELPAVLNTPGFRNAWAEWVGYWRERGRKLPASTVKLQYKRLAALGPALAIQSIHESIERKWTGLFDPRRSGKASQERSLFDGLGSDARTHSEPGKYAGRGITAGGTMQNTAPPENAAQSGDAAQSASTARRGPG